MTCWLLVRRPCHLEAPGAKSAGWAKNPSDDRECEACAADRVRRTGVKINIRRGGWSLCNTQQGRDLWRPFPYDRDLWRPVPYEGEWSSPYFDAYPRMQASQEPTAVIKP